VIHLQRAVIGLVLLLVAACHHPESAKHPGGGNGLRGLASFYSEPQMTASGERFDKRKLTAAHRTLPMGTMVRVTNQRNGRSVVVRINDRGPYSRARIIDVSEAAAKQLDMIQAGIVPVVLEVLGR
jgi:rare lipoprotein A